jgi:diguanylate cyclase (GGDEF)-like protein
MADTILQDTRSTDIARLGVDEFIILFPKTGFDTVRSAVEKIKDRLAEIMHEHRWPVTFSVDVVTFEELPTSVDQMIKVANSLMYDVKNNGKNGIRSAIFSGQRAIL